MNAYVVVEGKSEKKVYKNWIPYLNPALTFVDAIYDIVNNNFSIISGNGYPNYFDVIDDAILDVNNYNGIDKLIISIDSEEMSESDKLQEIEQHIAGKSCDTEIFIIIQHFCFEVWALGNKRIGPRNPPITSPVYTYKNYFNVLREDPELLPSYDVEELNRSQFAYKYLSSLVRLKGTTYTKKRPKAVLNRPFFDGVVNRFRNNGHIQSFENFLSMFN